MLQYSGLSCTWSRGSPFHHLGRLLIRQASGEEWESQIICSVRHLTLFGSSWVLSQEFFHRRRSALRRPEPSIHHA